MRNSLGLLCAVFGHVGFVACGDFDGAGHSEDAVGSTTAEIVNGAILTVDNLGTPRTPSTTCSGVLLTDRWMLTAKHCLTTNGTPTGTPKDFNEFFVGVRNGDGAWATGFFFHPHVDVALVSLDRSIVNPSTGRPYSNPLFFGSATSLVNKSLYCQAWDVITVNGVREGVLTSANLTVSTANTNQYELPVNGLGQVKSSGDSGSPCFITIDGVPRVTGIASFGNTVRSVDVAVDTFRDWAHGIMGNAATVFRDPNFAGTAQALLPGGPQPVGRYDIARLLVGNDAITSLRVPQGWSLNLYRDPGFQTFLGTFTAPVGTLGSGVNDQTSSAIVSGGVVLYRDANLQAPLVTYQSAGRFILPAAAANQVSSLTVPMGWRVQLFDESNVMGTSVVLQEGTHPTLGFMNDVASSLIIEAPVEVYVNPSFGGAVGRLLPGCYDYNALGVPNDSISSIHVPAFTTVEMFRHGGFVESLGTIVSSHASLSATVPAANDQISSICVRRAITTTQSSTAFGGTANLANDGNTDGNFYANTVTHTDFEFMPWWQADLGAVTWVGAVDIYNRSDCCADRLTNFNVLVSQDGFSWQQWNFPGQAGFPSTISINRNVRFVRVQLTSSNYLSLAEVKIR